MKFLVAKSKREAMLVAKTELLWEPVAQFKLLDLYRDEVTVIASPHEMRGHNIEVVYLLPSFDELQYEQWDDFYQAFARGGIKTLKVRL